MKFKVLLIDLPQKIVLNIQATLESEAVVIVTYGNVGLRSFYDSAKELQLICAGESDVTAHLSDPRFAGLMLGPVAGKFDLVVTDYETVHTEMQDLLLLMKAAKASNHVSWDRLREMISRCVSSGMRKIDALYCLAKEKGSNLQLTAT